jgi:ubiquinone/menaquinone biosynthesis C-methylase UbiE
MDELERAKQLYSSQYRIDFHNRDYVWHPRNPVSQVHSQILELAIIKAFNRLGIELVDQRILDVGCGYGRMLRFWTEMGASPRLMSGYDLAFYRLDRAHELSPHMNLVAGDASKLPYLSDSFDLVSQFSMFSSIHDERMREMAAWEFERVLRPSGWLVWYDIAAGKGGNTIPLPKSYVQELFHGLEMKYATPIFSRRLTHLIYYDPVLANIWERLHLDRKNGLIAFFQKPEKTGPKE